MRKTHDLTRRKVNISFKALTMKNFAAESMYYVSFWAFEEY